MAVEEGEFVYPKASGPKFEFSDDESEEVHDDEDSDSADEEDHMGKNGRSSRKEAAPEPKVCPSLSFIFTPPQPWLEARPSRLLTVWFLQVQRNPSGFRKLMDPILPIAPLERADASHGSECDMNTLMRVK